MNKKLLVGSLSLAVIGISSLAFISKPTYQEVSINNLNTEKVALYIKNDTGNYEKTNTIPTSGYTLNEERSRCNNNTKPIWDVEKGLLRLDEISINTNCYLYFDKDAALLKAEDMNLKVNTNIPDFTQSAIIDEGIFAANDKIYGGTTLYWRGAVTNNYVKFAGFCWRIIRINGDGSIRLIYDGTTCHANGISTVENIAVVNQEYNKQSGLNEYVGYTYVDNLQRPNTDSVPVDSNLKIKTDEWYNNNIGNNEIYSSKVATGKFCNDRELANGDFWTSQSNKLLIYEVRKRVQTDKKPDITCSDGDLYTLKAGAITADEVAYAGVSSYTENNSYYLYNGQLYWTMSPFFMNGNAFVFCVASNGDLTNCSEMSASPGIRPVINLRADIQFKLGTDGTLDNPYIVEGA